MTTGPSISDTLPCCVPICPITVSAQLPDGHHEKQQVFLRLAYAENWKAKNINHLSRVYHGHDEGKDWNYLKGTWHIVLAYLCQQYQ